VLQDACRFVVAADTPLGSYQLQVAIYLAEIGERLPLTSGANDGYVVMLTSIAINPKEE
jgi:hypothetical protein